MNGFDKDGVHRSSMIKRAMPRVRLLVLTLTVSLSFTGCASTKSTRSTSVNQSTVEADSLRSPNTPDDSSIDQPPVFVPSPSDSAISEPPGASSPDSVRPFHSPSVFAVVSIPDVASASGAVSPTHIDEFPPLLSAQPVRAQTSNCVSTNGADVNTSIRFNDMLASVDEDVSFLRIATGNVVESGNNFQPQTEVTDDANHEITLERLSPTEDSTPTPGPVTNSSTDPQLPSWMNFHIQATTVTQAHPSFRSPYVGPESFIPVEPSATSQTVTAYLAMRLAKSTEMIFNPELITGQGLSDVFGIASYPNGEMNRASGTVATPFIGRLFVRQEWGLGGAEEEIPEAFNQAAGTRDVDRVTLSVGKLAPTDIFDNNKYSHDPRTQFLDWSLMYNAAWDYPADLRGYSYGGSIDLNRQDWAVRYGIFAEPAVANVMPLDPNFLQAHGQVVECERRYQLKERPGKLRLLAYLNRAHMGSYALALAEMPVNPDIAATRDYRYKYGFGANLEQDLSDDVGVFARFGWNDGHTESWAFTEMDSLASAGISVMGSRWGRPKDQVGLAGVVGGLSSYHRAYLAAGGLGIQLGDGQLNYGLEKVVETYYRFEVRPGIQLSSAFQGVENPGFNRDRGPVAIGTIRLHFEF